MIGDEIHIKPHHLPPAKKIVSLVEDSLVKADGVFSFTVGGESGSGKSTLSLAIKQVLEEKGHEVFIFHQDDYFKLPPKDNHDQRVSDISHVGPQEVNLELMHAHIEEVESGAKQLKKPLVHYRENQIREVTVELNETDIVIAEGTYTSLLNDIDCKIFMLRNYHDTYEQRVKRARDPIVPFTEKVLEIEHQILKNHIPMADILVDKNYEVTARPSTEKES